VQQSVYSWQVGAEGLTFSLNLALGFIAIPYINFTLSWNSRRSKEKDCIILVGSGEILC
jgi:hypothetical protein